MKMANTFECVTWREKKNLTYYWEHHHLLASWQEGWVQTLI